MRRRHKRGCVRCRPRASGARRRPSHCPAVRPHRSGRFTPPPPFVLCVFLVSVGSPIARRSRDRGPRDPRVGMALRLWRGSALRCSRSAPHRLRPALTADCAGAALPRARVPVARCWARRNRCHAAPACGRTAHVPGTVRGLRPRRVRHGVGPPPSPAARNVRITPRHAVSDSGKAERDGLTSRSRRHDSTDPAAPARVVRGLLRLVGHPRLDHMGYRCSRTGTSPRSAPATPTPGRRRRNDGGRSDPRGCSASSVNSGVGSPGRLASRWPRRRPCPRSPVCHGPRGHP